MTAPRKLRVGLALGSGSARGWAHIGVIRALEAAGIQPEVVCGASTTRGARSSVLPNRCPTDGERTWPPK